MAQGLDDEKFEYKAEDGRALAQVPEKRESPWATPHLLEDPKRRVVGWRNGSAITKADQEKILKSEKRARQEYFDAKKAIALSQASQSNEPMEGLPPNWQAFWSTVPELDAQAAFKAHAKGKERQEKQKEHQAAVEADATVLPLAAAEGEPVEEEITRLMMELRRRKEVLAGRQTLVSEWEKKLNRARLLDRDEEVERRRVSRKLDHASYSYGVMQGKLRSSETYFRYIYEDAKTTHARKVTTLSRANALMEKTINEMKGDVRQLLKVAAEALPAPPPEGGSISERSLEETGEETSLKKGPPLSLTDEEEASGSDANASATGKTSGKPAP